MEITTKEGSTVTVFVPLNDVPTDTVTDTVTDSVTDSVTDTIIAE